MIQATCSGSVANGRLSSEQATVLWQDASVEITIDQHLENSQPVAVV